MINGGPFGVNQTPPYVNAQSCGNDPLAAPSITYYLDYIPTLSLIHILRRPAQVLAHPWRLPSGGADHSLVGRYCDAAGARGELLSSAGGALREAALHLPRLPGCGISVVLVSWATEN